MRKMLIFAIIISICLVFSGNAQALNYTMSWDFQIFNDANARQVAINVAEKQHDLVDVEDPIEEFTDGLDRRLQSSAQREIVDMIMDEDEVPYGEFEAGNLNISVAEDPQTGEVIVEITDIITGDSTIITYEGDDWGSDFGF